MMAFKSAMLLVLFLAVAINAQSVTISDTSAPIPVGVWSSYYTITANNLVQLPFTLTFDQTGNNNPTMEFSATSFTFTPQTRTLSFRVKSDIDISPPMTTASVSVITDHTAAPTVDQPWGPFTASLPFTFVNRTITLDSSSFNSGINRVNTDSQPLQIRVNVAPTTGDLRLTPIPNNTAITFSPSTIVIKQGTLSGEFTWKSSIYGTVGPDQLRFNVDGPDAELYYKENMDGYYTYSVQQNTWRFRSTVSQPNILLGGSTVQNNAFYVYAVQNVTGNLDITPQAADFTFTPTKVTLSPSQKVAIFNVSTTNPSFTGTTNVNIFSSGSYVDFPFATTAPITSATVNVPRRTVTVTTMDASNDLTINNVTYISITISAPVVNELTVSLSAARLGFNSSAGWTPTVTVSFKGPVTSIVVAALGQQLGADTVRYALGGADADSFLFSSGSTTTGSAFTVAPAHFITPNQYLGYQSFWVGVESEPIPIRASISPPDWVSLRLFAPNVRFNPQVLTFRNGSEQQYFTITPMYTNAGLNGFATTVEYLLDGPNYNLFTAVGSQTINVNSRTFQIQGSAHLETDNLDGMSTGTLRLHKTYKFWTTVNYIAKGDLVSLTPVSPYFSFSPKVINFNGDNSRVLLEATVTGVPADGTATIDYILGGKDGGMYTPAGSQSFAVGLRPLQIVAAQVTPDARNSEKKSVLLTNKYIINNAGVQTPWTGFNTGMLSSYHVQSFLIRSFALPDKDLTITPHCPHVKFSPSKITLKAANAVRRIDFTANTGNEIVVTDGTTQLTYTFNSTGVYAEANFTVEAYAAGTHQVTFGLSGSDKDYYQRVPPVSMTFNLVMRPDSEPFGASSSSSLLPSFVVAAVIAALALVL